MYQNIVFHRDGTVTKGGQELGTWHAPDPSGAPWARSLIWVFRAWDGKVDNARSRKSLEHFALTAWMRSRR